MTLVRRELPLSRSASRPDRQTGRRIADARTLQSCPHRASADATQEIQPLAPLALARAGFMRLAGAFPGWSWPPTGSPRERPRIGFLEVTSPSDRPPLLDAFRQRLRELGWVEGQNIVIDYRYAEGRVDRLPDLAAELVRRQACWAMSRS
jgi:hypothetical protein